MAQRHRDERSRRKERPIEVFTTGLGLTVLFGVIMGVFHGAWFFIFPLIFAGVLPMIRGLVSLVTNTGSRRALEEHGEEAPELPAASGTGTRAEDEKQILYVAREEGGTVTAAIAALKTSLSIDRAEQILQDLARHGHASMNVGEDGRIEYRFPEFGPRLEPRIGDGREP